MGIIRRKACWWNGWTEGFTLLECMVALLVLNVFLLTVTWVIPQVSWVSQEVGHNRQHQFELFLLQLEHELQDGEYQGVNEGIIVSKTIRENGQLVTKQILIHQYQDKVRKTFRGSGGHQPLLMGIQQVEFSEEEGYVLIEVRYPDGEVNHGKWTIT